MNLRLFFNPYMQVLLTALLGTASEVFLKIGAEQTANLPSVLPWLGISGLASKWVWLGIVLTVASLGTWAQAIRSIPLSVAFTLSNMVHVLVPLSCFFFLGEAIGTRRWVGIALVITGLIVIAKPFARIDERI